DENKRKNKNKSNTKQRGSKNKKPELNTQNREMKDLLGKVKLAAKTKASLLITGENGTGKEVFAQLVHYFSSRSQKRMVEVNCGAIPSELVESELFVHEMGAFTGANEKRYGCIELADKSSLFLDEIGELLKIIK